MDCSCSSVSVPSPIRCGICAPMTTALNIVPAVVAPAPNIRAAHVPNPSCTADDPTALPSTIVPAAAPDGAACSAARRHTFASQLLSSYVPLEWVARQLGHSDTKMIKRHYGRWIPDDTRSMAGMVSEMMGFRAAGGGLKNGISGPILAQGSP